MFQKYYGVPVIKVLVWSRRVGKSYLLQSLMQDLVETKKIPKNNVFYINKEFPVWDFIKTNEDLKKYFEERKTKQKITNQKIMFCIDEVQNIKWREKFINWLLAQYSEQIDIWITGSNAYMLSSDLATLIAWRYVAIDIYPLSLEEYWIFSSKKVNKKLLERYLKYWWLPWIFNLPDDEEIVFSYLISIYNTVFLKDVIKYHNIKNTDFFEKLYKYVMNNVSTIFSAKSIRDYLRNEWIRMSVDTVIDYLKYWEYSFLLNKVESQDPISKKFFDIYNKYYTTDLWIRNALVGYQKARDMSKLLENYVFGVLKRYGYQIKIWRLKNNTEIDFIAAKNWEIKYLQVAYWLSNESIIQREYWSLIALKNSWPKYVVTMDDDDFGVIDGVNHVKVWELEDVL